MLQYKLIKEEPTTEFYDRSPELHQLLIAALAGEAGAKLVKGLFERHGVPKESVDEFLTKNVDFLTEGMARFMFHGYLLAIGKTRDSFKTEEEFLAFMEAIGQKLNKGENDGSH